MLRVRGERRTYRLLKRRYCRGQGESSFISSRRWRMPAMFWSRELQIMPYVYELVVLDRHRSRLLHVGLQETLSCLQQRLMSRRLSLHFLNCDRAVVLISIGIVAAQTVPAIPLLKAPTVIRIVIYSSFRTLLCYIVSTCLALRHRQNGYSDNAVDSDCCYSDSCRSAAG